MMTKEKPLGEQGKAAGSKNHKDSICYGQYNPPVTSRQVTLSANIAATLGHGKEVKNGDGWLSLCPCHSDNRPSLSIKDNGNDDVVVTCHAGCGWQEIKKELRGRGLLPKFTPGKKSKNRPNKSQDSGKKKPSEGSAKEKNSFIWKKATKDDGRIKRYFKNRSISFDDNENKAFPVPPALKWNSYTNKKTGDKVHLVVAAALNPNDKTVKAVQRLFIDIDDYTKTGAKMLGNMQGRGVYFYRQRPMVELIVGEGIETTLSVMQVTGKNGVAALSTSGMKHIRLPDETEIIYILVDSDKSFAGQKAACELARRFEKNDGSQAFIVSPDDSCFTESPRKLDFNDLLQEDNSGGLIKERIAAAVPFKELDWEAPGDEEDGKNLDSPLPLVKKNEESQSFPFEVLGHTMAATCKAIQENVQAPDAIIAQSVLGAANLAVQGLGNIIIDGRVFPVSLFLLSIAGTGERKSAVDSLALSRHREIEKDKISKLAGEQGLYEINNAAFEHERSALIKDKKKSLPEKQAGLEQLQGQEPVKPLDQTLLVTDFTFEGLFKLFQIGTPNKGLFADEGGQVTGGHGMKKESILATAAGLSKFWDGARVDRIRVLDGFSHLYGRRLSVHLMMQETVGLNFYTNDILTDQGLISRFLAAWPTSTVGSRVYAPVSIKDSGPMIDFYEKVSAAMGKELQYKEDSNGQELDPPCLPLSPEAKHLWENCYNEIESESGPKKMLAPIRGLANKAAEHAARIAGTVQLFEDPTSTEIKAEAMGYGIGAIEWYLEEALRIAGSFSPEGYLLKAKEVLRWIHDNALSVVALPDIYQYSPVRSASQARKAVEILKAHNHLLNPDVSPGEEPEPMRTRSGKTSREWWIIHPDSKVSFIDD